MDNKKRIPNYSEYLKESQVIREGLWDRVKGAVTSAIKWLGDKLGFSGKGSKFLNAMLAQKEGKLPEGVRVIPTPADVAEFNQAAEGVNFGTSDVPVREHTSFDFVHFLNEDQVKLTHPNPKVQNVTSKSLMRFIEDAYESKDPLMIWGAPGIGKTAIVNAVADKFGGRLIDATLTTMAPEDFFLPAVQKDDRGMERAVDLAKEWLPVYHEKFGEEGDAAANGPDGKGGILFLDELNRARQEVQDVCLKLVLERKVGQYRLGSKWAVIAASNREGDDSTSTMNFSIVLGNRFTQVNYAPTFEDWKQWAISAKDPDGRFVVDPTVLAFIEFASKWFHNLNSDDDAPVWASPRSWTKASQQYIRAKMKAEEEGTRLDDDTAEEIIAANVGKDAAAEFIGFVKLSRKVNIEDMKLAYTNPEKCPLPPKGSSDGYRPDETYAMLSAIAFDKRDQQITPQEAENVIKYAIRIQQASWATKLLSALTGVHPYLKKDDKFRTALNMFYDAYPVLGKGK